MANPFGVFEDIWETPRRKVFRFLGVDWLATPYAWISIPLIIPGSIPLAFALYLLPDLAGQVFSAVPQTIGQAVVWGLIFGLGLFVVNYVHASGHVISARMVRGVMDANLITATRIITLYSGDQSGFGKGVHIGRSIGGPAANILLGGLALGINALLGGSVFVEFMGYANLAFGIGALGPFPSVDGWVIWGELLGLRKES